MSPVRIGILGAARIAPAAVVKPARKSPEAEVVAVAARDRARADAFAAKHHVPRAFGSYAELLADPDIDAVYNPLPNGLHAEWTLAALDAGKHVLCEKPFTANTAEAEQVAAAADRSGLVVMEAFHYRYHPLAQRMQDIVTSGELGTLQHVEAVLCFPLPKFSDIRYQYDLAGGATMDVGTYTVHIARLLGGEEPTVTSATAKLRSPDIDRAMTAELAFPSGHTGRITCSMWSSDVLKTYARARGDRGELHVINPTNPQMWHRMRVKVDGAARTERFTRRPSYEFQLDAFTAAVLRGEPTLTPPADSIANMRVLDAIYTAAGMRPRGPDRVFVLKRVGAAAALVATVALAGCGGSSDSADAPTTTTVDGGTTSTTVGTSTSSTTTAPPRTYPEGTFDGADAALEQRVANAGLRGGFLRIAAQDGAVIHEHGVGGVSGPTPLDVASTTKWLTAATFMTFVDDRAIGLDDDIARWLPEFAGSTPAITPRQLLDHTSGVRDNPCQNGGVSLAVCVETLASSPREFPAGTAFSYGNAPLLVVGRLIEVLGGADFAGTVQERLTGPLGMTATTWPGAPAAPNPAFGATTTVDDYGRFVAMLLHHGDGGGTRVLSATAVDEMVRNQVASYDTTHDYSVGITGIPRYGLGCWPDVVSGDGATEVVSGNGGKGFYPWIDFTTRTWGIVGVQDDRGADVAVPASQVVEVAARTAVTG